MPIMRLYFLVFAIYLLIVPCLAKADNVGPREVPRDFVSFDQTETHRIRITNEADAPVEVSADHGQSWTIIGRVTVPATDNLSGYLASGYAPVSSVAATAIHGIRIRVGDLSTAYPKLINILPKEFAQTPVYFGGHIAGASGIYTNIPTGTSIFRDLAPYSGNPVYQQNNDNSLTNLPENFIPHMGDVFVIVVKRPSLPLVEVDFENVKNGDVTGKFANGVTKKLATVLKPVYGTGRFDGTSYTGVGAINTSHMGVLTISTAPVSGSPLLEGTGDERRGGIQIQPSYHNSQSDEAWADSILIIGNADKKNVPDLEGSPPLFFGYFDLCWQPDDMDHSWHTEVKINNNPNWVQIPKVIGNSPNALKEVTALRVIRNSYGDSKWFAARIKANADFYMAQERDLVTAGKMALNRGRVTITADQPSSKTRYVSFYIDGKFRGMTNTAPYSYTWDTTRDSDGEHTIEAHIEDENNKLITATKKRVWVDNAEKIKPVAPVSETTSNNAVVFKKPT